MGDSMFQKPRKPSQQNNEHENLDDSEFQLRFQVVEHKLQIRKLTEKLAETKSELNHNKKRVYALYDEIHKSVEHGKYIYDENDKAYLVYSIPQHEAQLIKISNLEEALATSQANEVRANEELASIRQQKDLLEQNLNNTINELQTKLTLEQEKKEKLGQEKRKIEEQFSKCKKKLEEMLAEAVNQCENMRAEESRLKKVVHDLKCNLDKSTETIKADKKEIEKLKEEKENLEKVLDDTKFIYEEQTIKMSEQINELKTLLHDTDEMLSQTEIKYEGLETRYKYVSVENIELKKENEEKTKTLAAKEDLFNEMNEEVANLETTLTKKEEELQAHLKEREAIEATIVQLKSELSEAKEENLQLIESKERELKAKENVINELKETNIKIKTELKRLRPSGKPAWKR